MRERKEMVLCGCEVLLYVCTFGSTDAKELCGCWGWSHSKRNDSDCWPKFQLGELTWWSEYAYAYVLQSVVCQFLESFTNPSWSMPIVCLFGLVDTIMAWELFKLCVVKYCELWAVCWGEKKKEEKKLDEVRRKKKEKNIIVWYSCCC